MKAGKRFRSKLEPGFNSWKEARILAGLDRRESKRPVRLGSHGPHESREPERPTFVNEIARRFAGVHLRPERPKPLAREGGDQASRRDRDDFNRTRFTEIGRDVAGSRPIGPDVDDVVLAEDGRQFPELDRKGREIREPDDHENTTMSRAAARSTTTAAASCWPRRRSSAAASSSAAKSRKRRFSLSTCSASTRST